ncbi:unnamed protein product [Heterobilharzia americana]|nr:unnamed protein product [Heterobilharzia americana]
MISSTTQSTNSDVEQTRQSYDRLLCESTSNHAIKLDSILNTKEVSNHENLYGFYLFRVSGLEYGRFPTITLKEILDSHDGELVSSIQPNTA